MATYERVDVIPSRLENTHMQLVKINGTPRLYEIAPDTGYLLHDSRTDDYTYDNEGNVVSVTLRYKPTTSSCTIVQFNDNEYNIYAVAEDSVPEESIIHEDDNTEIMSTEDTETE